MVTGGLVFFIETDKAVGEISKALAYGRTRTLDVWALARP